jgi:hypothetical protein
MTAEILYTGQLERTELPSFIENCAFTRLATYFLAENLPTQVVQPKDRQGLLTFTFFKPDQPFETYQNYTSGRIFSSLGELRWECQGELVRIVYLGAPSFAAVERAVGGIYRSKFSERSLELKELDSRQRFYYLFGTKLEMATIKQINGEQVNGGQIQNAVGPGDFAELRIHRVLHYPAPGHVPDKGYVQLQVQEYVDPNTGQVRLFRFQGLDEERNTGEEWRR